MSLGIAPPREAYMAFDESLRNNGSNATAHLRVAICVLADASFNSATQITLCLYVVVQEETLPHEPRPNFICDRLTGVRL